VGRADSADRDAGNTDSAPLAQILIRSIDQVQTQPFVAVARAKGASRSRVLWRHVARNAMLPVLTIAGILLGELIAGALITETVFGRSGLGQLTLQAVLNQDVAVLQAIVVISAAAFVTLNLLVDLLFPLLDPAIENPYRSRRMSSISFEKSSAPERDLGAVESEGTLPTHRPRRRRVPLTLLLAWAVIAIAVLWALAPQLFTAYSGTEGIAGAQRLAPGGPTLVGHRSTGARPLCAHCLWRFADAVRRAGGGRFRPAVGHRAGADCRCGGRHRG
jgi:hypothetical protein